MARLSDSSLACDFVNLGLSLLAKGSLRTRPTPSVNCIEFGAPLFLQSHTHLDSLPAVFGCSRTDIFLPVSGGGGVARAQEYIVGTREDLAQRVFACDAIHVVMDVPRRGAVRKSSLPEVCNTNEILTAPVRERSTEDDAARLEQLNTRAVLIFQRSCAYRSRSVCCWGYELSVHTTVEISRATGASVTDMRHSMSRFAFVSVRLRHVRSITFVARCLLLGVVASSRGVDVFKSVHMWACFVFLRRSAAPGNVSA